MFRASGMGMENLAEYAKDYIAGAIAKKFGVSADVINRRLDREKLWPPET